MTALIKQNWVPSHYTFCFFLFPMGRQLTNGSALAEGQAQ